jgi:hypothetical protein
MKKVAEALKSVGESGATEGVEKQADVETIRTTGTARSREGQIEGNGDVGSSDAGSGRRDEFDGVERNPVRWNRQKRSETGKKTQKKKEEGGGR